MSTNKLLQSLSDDPQLEKQIGCMAGILQLFDRHQVLTGRRLYGHKRIFAAAPKTQNAATSNCGSPASEVTGTSSDLVASSRVQLPTDSHKQKQPTSISIIGSSSEQQKNQPLPLVPSLSPPDAKSSSAHLRTQRSGSVSDAPLHANGGDHFSKISFEMARSSILAPRRLDSSRSLHEGRANASHEAKVYARRSVDTAERAAAAARGALKELSRISADIGGPRNINYSDHVSIHDIVRSSFAKEQQAPRSTTSHSTLGSSATHRAAFAPQMSYEAGVGHPKPDQEPHVDFAQCNPISKQARVTNTQGPQAMARAEGASRPPRYFKPKADAPTKSCADISESLKLLAKLREANPPYNDLLLTGNARADYGRIQAQSAVNRPPRPPATSTRDLGTEAPTAFASAAPLSKVVDRIPARTSSYEPPRSSSVDAFPQVVPKTKEIPRLSLDGRRSKAGIKVDREAGALGKARYPRSLLPSRSVSCSNSDCDTESLHEKRTSFSSNVVARLMGLEEMPSEEVPESAILQNKADPYSSSDQKASKLANHATEEENPTFSKCGKYVSASFFPSKRRDDICIAINAKEEEEDRFLQMKPLTHQEAQTLSVRVGASNFQAGAHRLATTTESHMGHPCFQPKNHHLMEDRPPHVLSPAARLCAQIEELQRADSVYKTLDRGLRTMEMHGSEQDLEALKQLLGAIDLKKQSSQCAGLDSEKLPTMRARSGEQHLGSRRVPYPQEQYVEQQVSPSGVIWKTKRMLNDELHAHKRYQNFTSSRVPAEVGLKKKVKKINLNPGPLPSYRQNAPLEAYIPATHTRAESRSSAAEINLSALSTPKRTKSSHDCVTPTTTGSAQPANVGRRLASRANAPPNIMSARFSTSPQTPPSQQSLHSYSSSYSWEGSSVSSTSSCHANSSYQAAGKKNRQLESQERKKAGTSIHKDKEASKATLVSVKSSPTTSVEKRSNNSVAGSRPVSSRTVRRCTPLQNPDHARFDNRSPTKTSARKAEEVKRKLTFSQSSPGKIQSSEMEREDPDTDFVDKIMVSIINSDSLKGYAHLDQNRSTEKRSNAGHDKGPSCLAANPYRNELRDTCSNVTLMKTEVGVKSPPLLLPCDDEQQVTPSSSGRDDEPMMQDMGSPVTLICIPAGPLKLPQVPQEENEDSECQEENSTGSCEQPSPCSVLECPFYEEGDVASPPTATEFIRKLEETEEVANDKRVNGDSEVASCGPQHSYSASPGPPPNHDIHNCSMASFTYVTQLLDMATNSNDTHSRPDILTLRPLEPHSFLQLEEENLNSCGNVSACKCEIKNMWRRRWLFDSVSASLERRLRRWRGCQRQPWLLACECDLKRILGRDWSPALQQGMIGLDEEKNVRLSREGGRVLLQEVWEELRGERKWNKKCDSVGTDAYREEECGGAEQEEEGTCDGVGRMLEEDMKGGPFHTSPDSWASVRVEKGELGLDLERLIFKDLIDHTIRDLGLLPLPTTPRRLTPKPHNN